MLGLILGWLLLIGGRIWLFFTQDGYTPDSLPSFLVEMSWMLLGIAVLISSLYYALWKALKNMPVLHVTLGVLSGIQGCVAVISSLAAARFLTALTHPDAAALTLGDLFLPAWNAPLWSALCIPCRWSWPCPPHSARSGCRCGARTTTSAGTITIP